MQRLSEMVLGLLIISEEVVTSIGTYGKDIAAKLVELWTAAGQGLEDGQSPPDVEGNLTALQGGLAATEKRMVEADRRHVRQLAVTMSLRQKVREVTGRVYRKFSTIRRTVEELHGKGNAFVLAGIEGPTAQKPRKLLRQCELALARLLEPGLELPPHEVDGIEVDPLKLALGLQADVDELRSLLADQRRERRLLQKTRKQKNRAIDAHRQTLVWTARTVEGYYMLAGEPELAERLRPATRRPSRPPTEPDDRTPSGDPETPGEPEPIEGPETAPEVTEPEGRPPADA